MKLLVRPARANDAAAMSAVLIASITELCAADHGNKPDAIAAWCANKSEASVLAMMQSLENGLYVAERNETVVAVGAITGDAVTLNYVDPVHRRTGVSRTLLAALERILSERGVLLARLTSTAIARAFYLAQGWQEDGPPVPGRFISGIPMHKALVT